MIELLVVLIIAGFLAALAAPTFMGMQYRSNVNNGAAKLQSALQEVQREAMRKSKYCQVLFPNVALSNYSISNSAIMSDCFATSDPPLSNFTANGSNPPIPPGFTSVPTGFNYRTFKNLNISHNIASLSTLLSPFQNNVSSIIFDNMGQPTDGTQNPPVAIANSASLVTIVISASNTSTQKCLIVSYGLGLMRRGDYTSAINSSAPIPTSCTITQ